MKPADKKGNEDIVLTPAGPRPREMVHQIRPGEAIRIDESGYPRIVREQGGGAMKIPEDMVITPGGARPKSLVHQIEPGHVLDASNGRLRKLAPSGEAVADLGPVALRREGTPLMPGNVSHPPGPAPALPGGWIIYADWNNNTGTPISSFSTTWTVPPPPATQSGQLIYIFNGIQNQGMIYQPVLQWGNNGSFGGNYWVVASWYADGQGGYAAHSTSVQVNPGDVLTGIMMLTGRTGNSFSYGCTFPRDC